MSRIFRLTEVGDCTLAPFNNFNCIHLYVYIIFENNLILLPVFSTPYYFFYLQALEFGMIGINGANLSAASTPFGGVKESGIGREGGQWGKQSKR